MSYLVPQVNGKIRQDLVSNLIMGTVKLKTSELSSEQVENVELFFLFFFVFFLAP